VYSKKKTTVGSATGGRDGCIPWMGSKKKVKSSKGKRTKTGFTSLMGSRTAGELRGAAQKSKKDASVVMPGGKKKNILCCVGARGKPI